MSEKKTIKLNRQTEKPQVVEDIQVPEFGDELEQAHQSVQETTSVVKEKVEEGQKLFANKKANIALIVIAAILVIVFIAVQVFLAIVG